MPLLSSPVKKNDNVVVITGRDRGKKGRVLRVVPAGALPGGPRPLLLVDNFIDHTITILPVAAGGQRGCHSASVIVSCPWSAC